MKTTINRKNNTTADGLVIRNCPFCGKKAKYYTILQDGLSMFVFECSNCGGKIKPRKRLIDALKSWNKRAKNE